MKSIILVKETNAGGLQIERYKNNKIIEIVTDLEFNDSLSMADIARFGRSWVALDAGQGYTADNNTNGNLKGGGNELIVAKDMIDYDGNTVVKYENGELTFYVDRMGPSARRLLGFNGIGT